MQPLGRKPTRFPSKTDIHPKKGFVNWWESEICTEDKKSYRASEKKQILKELNSESNYATIK